MKIAIPTSEGLLSPHFGHCSEFTIADVEPSAKTVSTQEVIPAPPHEPGMLPRWLKELGVEVVIAGGMGSHAQSLFAEQGVQVIIGAPANPISTILDSYLSGMLLTGVNQCDH